MWVAGYRGINHANSDTNALAQGWHSALKKRLTGKKFLLVSRCADWLVYTPPYRGQMFSLYC